MKTDLSVNLCGRKLQNPLILASGILGTEAELLARVAKTGLGAVTTKSCGLYPRMGHENPTVLGWEHGLINAVGLTNPGVKQEVKEIIKLKKLVKGTRCKIIASFFGCTVEEFGKVAKILIQAQPDFLEANISCPNVASELGRSFGASIQDTAEIVRAVKKITDIPLIVKLNPNVTDIVQIAKAVENEGAQALCVANALLGMIIDLESRKPILTNKTGGVSGPAIRPIAVRCVWQVAAAVKIPIIGLGGVTYGKDAIEMIMAGATAVGVGSATYYRGIEAFSKITKEMQKWLEDHKIKSLDQIKGISHAKN